MLVALLCCAADLIFGMEVYAPLVNGRWCTTTICAFDRGAIPFKVEVGTSFCPNGSRFPLHSSE